MEVIINQLNAIRKFLSVYPTITVGKTDVGSWIVADEDIEVSALVVVRFMLHWSYKNIGDIHLHHHGDGKTYTLVGPRYFSDLHDEKCDESCGCAENTQGQLGNN